MNSKNEPAFPTICRARSVPKSDAELSAHKRPFLLIEKVTVSALIFGPPASSAGGSPGRTKRNSEEPRRKNEVIQTIISTAKVFHGASCDSQLNAPVADCTSPREFLLLE